MKTLEQLTQIVHTLCLQHGISGAQELVEAIDEHIKARILIGQPVANQDVMRKLWDNVDHSRAPPCIHGYERGDCPQGCL